MTSVLRCFLALVALAGFSCGNDDGPIEPAPGESVRTYRMGFSAIPPRMNQAEAVAVLDLWSPRADAAIMRRLRFPSALGQAPRGAFARAAIARCGGTRLGLIVTTSVEREPAL